MDPNSASLAMQLLYGGLGGQQAVAASLARGLADNGIRSVALLVSSEKDLAISEELEAQCQVIHVAKGGKFDANVGIRVAELVREHRPDCFVAHSPYGMLPAFRALGRSSAKRPIVKVEHQSRDLWSLGHRIRTFYSLPFSDGIVFLTKESERRYPFRFLVRWLRMPVAVIPTGIDLKEYSPGDTTRPNSGRRRVGMMGRLVPGKRFDLLVSALASLPTSERFELIIAGDGLLRSSLEDQARAAGISENVSFLGAVASSEVPRFLRSLDVYAHFSDGETLSTSVLQAMACGVPIVASEVPGLTTLLRESGAGVLVSNGHKPERHAEAILNMLHGSQEGRMPGREFLVDNHSVESMGAMFAAFIDVCSSTSKRRHQ